MRSFSLLLGLLGLNILEPCAPLTTVEEPLPQKRNCGGCTACCTAMANSAVEPPKPTFSSCQFQCADGCSIHADKPQGCREFNCLWVQDTGKLFKEDERPDKFGIVAVAECTQFGPTIRIYESTDGALRREDVQELIHFWAQKVAVLAIVRGGKRFLYGKPKVLELARKLGAVKE